MARNAERMESRGREAVHRLREALEEQRLVARFVDAYVAAQNRSGLKESPLRYRELLTTIHRESWLALAAKIELLLPGKISRRQKALLRGAEAEAADAFREAFLDELGKTLLLPAGEREELRRDLILYGQIAARLPPSAPTRRTANAAQGAFVDRCALLLDPSLLEKARQAAARFLFDLETLAEKTLELVFGPPHKKKKRGLHSSTRHRPERNG